MTLIFDSALNGSTLTCDCCVSADAVGLDGDNPEHVQWVFQESLKRAAEFKITGVTYRLTQGKAGWTDASEKL